MPDPAEGLDADGHITTGVDPAHLQAPFREVVEAAVAGCRERCTGTHALYVYGSVATGMAVAGTSDLDLLLVADATNDLDRVAGIGEELSHRYGNVVREVALATATRAAVFADTEDGLAWRCFLKHYCVCADGVDLAADMPPCRPTPALVRGFASDTEDLLAGWRRRAGRASPDELGRLAFGVARKLLLTCAAIVSLETAGWTTDRDRAAAVLAERHPAQAGWLARAVGWSDPRRTPTVDRPDLQAFVDEFGSWVVRRLGELTDSPHRGQGGR